MTENYRSVIKAMGFSLTSIPIVTFVTEVAPLYEPDNMTVLGSVVLLFIFAALQAVVPRKIGKPSVYTPKPSTIALPTPAKLKPFSLKETFMSMARGLVSSRAQLQSQPLIQSQLLLMEQSVQERYPFVRGFMYYAFGYWMWGSVAGMVVLFRHFVPLYYPQNHRYYVNGEIYLDSAYGYIITMWNGTIHYALCAIMMFQIDNHTSCRPTAMFWCGSTLTSQVILYSGVIAGTYANTVQAGGILSLSFFFLPAFIFARFLLKPRVIESPFNQEELYESSMMVASKRRKRDGFIFLLLAYSLGFSLLRLGSVLESQEKIFKQYRTCFEPYMVEPTRFGFMWVLTSAYYGPIYQLLSMYAIARSGCEWMIDMSPFYAGAMFQGTSAYLLGLLFATTPVQYKTALHILPSVITCNVLLVVTGFLVMQRCRSDPDFFKYGSKKIV